MVKRALITGGAGFIGSHLAKFLLKKQYRIVCLDNLSVGSLENLKDCRKNPNFRFIKGDVLDERLFGRLLRKKDMVFHLAAIVGVDNIFKNPLETIRTDFLGTGNVLKHAQEIGAKKVFFASSSEVYGTNTKMPLREDSERILGETTNPRWSYSAAKALAEQLCFAYRDKYGLPVTVGRFFNVYGPGCYNSVYKHVIAKFALQALRDKDLIIYGNGLQTRSFIYADDVVGAIYKLSLKGSPGVYNIGNPKSIRIIDLARKIISLTNSKSKIVKANPKQKFGKNFEDIIYRTPDVSKIKKEIGFSPSVTLDVGLRRTIENLRYNV